MSGQAKCESRAPYMSPMINSVEKIKTTPLFIKGANFETRNWIAGVGG